jgi:radical SAM superfamily enzyme YgiQ (UPF0313 family)
VSADSAKERPKGTIAQAQILPFPSRAGDRQIVVYLAHLHSSLGQNLRVTVPLGMTYVHAYLRARFGNSVTIRQFTTVEQVDQALDGQIPDIFAFGTYSWNTALTDSVIRTVKERHPDIVVAVAGPNVPTEKRLAAAALRRKSAIDFLISREGEQPTGNLVDACQRLSRSHDVVGTVIQGCYSLTVDGRELQGESLDRVGKLDVIPSPYLTGLCDEFLGDAEYIPLIQTSRGCPYGCTFCVAGHDWWSKLHAFDVERVKAELDYISERTSNPMLRIADENFGILPRDVEIAEHIHAVKNRSSYPSLVQVYTDKHLTKNVREVMLLMRDLIPLNISFQSLDKQVLKNIKRVNVKDEMIEEAATFARDHGLVLSTELIFALPGETVSSFINSLDKVLDFRFDNVIIHPLSVLDHAEMAFPEYRERFKLKSRFALAENGYSEYGGRQNFEIEELVVETSTITESEYMEFFKFLFFFNFALFFGWLRELVFCFESYGVRGTRIMSAMLADPARCPVLAEYASRYLRGLHAMMCDSPEDVVSLIRQTATMDPERITDNQFGPGRFQHAVFSDLFTEGRFEEVVREFVQAGLRIADETLGDDRPSSFREQLNVLANITVLSFIPLHYQVPEDVEIESRFDLVRWMQSNFKQPLSDFELNRAARFRLYIRGYEYYERIWANPEKNLRRIYLRNFASSTGNGNRRRHLDYSINGVLA